MEKVEKVLIDRNPYDGNTIAEFKFASRGDLDEAYRSAAAAQKIWAQVNPFEKRAVLEKAITWIEQNEADIVDIIIDELGGTHLKAMIEIFLVKTFIKEASTYPLRMTGEILPSTVDGKENRLYRVPVGVVGVISPFNFPFNLSMRSVAPALGAGNGVVLKPHDDTPITGGTLIAKIFEETEIPKGLLNVIVADIGELGGQLCRTSHSAGHFVHWLRGSGAAHWRGRGSMPEESHTRAWRQQRDSCAQRR